MTLFESDSFSPNKTFYEAALQERLPASSQTNLTHGLASQSHPTVQQPAEKFPTEHGLHFETAPNFYTPPQQLQIGSNILNPPAPPAPAAHPYFPPYTVPHQFHMPVSPAYPHVFEAFNPPMPVPDCLAPAEQVQSLPTNLPDPKLTKIDEKTVFLPALQQASPMESPPSPPSPPASELWSQFLATRRLTPTSSGSSSRAASPGEQYELVHDPKQSPIPANVDTREHTKGRTSYQFRKKKVSNFDRTSRF